MHCNCFSKLFLVFFELRQLFRLILLTLPPLKRIYVYMVRVAITGGIGSGKSTLCQYFVDNGVTLYDSDKRAKSLMSSNEELRNKISELLGSEAYDDLGINRAYIANQIFSCESKREALNAIVHPAVLADFERVAQRAAEGDAPYIIFESAILFECDLAHHFDYTVAVLAPEELRLSRVVNRDGCTLEQAKSRLSTQMSDDEMHAKADYAVVNIFEEDLEGAAQRLDQLFKSLARKKEQE